ncbi:DNA alkylation repair protein [Marinicella sp. S1101]|uniref:DNA alkylation repair protein n=1 Tax=Marinicella marina TaxID=2996016 RepID=UPI0022609036|nr:DNA alkylation repair protein [Marinicella marina]MCX7553658.1 DNA alkylation repair protein [Marinicella marina]MDJ1140282.1 DNA alkylation repair protein [Marinicella marina]
MKQADVLKLLQAHQNERGIKNWIEMEQDSEYKSFGIGLTVLRKLAKEVGKNHELALQLWNSDCYDMKVLGVLIDEPKKITREQMEAQVKDLDYGMMVHVFSACGAPVAKVNFIDEVADEWVKSDDSVKRRCAYGFIYELSKSTKKSAPDDDYFMKYIRHIDETYDNEDQSVHLSMGGALMGIGKRNLKLNQAALKVAQRIGAIPVESGKTQCEPMDISKHLTSNYLKKKFAKT